MKDMRIIKWPLIKDIVGNFIADEVSATDNVKASLEALKNEAKHNSVLEIIEERSLERAKELDALSREERSSLPLGGVPFVAKDNYLTFGSDTTAASNILKGFKAPYQATVIDKLERAGAICVGKANLDSFAHGASTENSDFGPSKNPHDIERVPGGSSGGSAAAVALGLAPFSLGTDTGGSIRLPASFTGTVGLKPTYGLASRFGVVAMVSSTDVMGPITYNAEDVSPIMDAIVGVDPRDSTSIDSNDLNFNELDLNHDKKYKFAVIDEHMSDGVSADVKDRTEAVIKKLEESGHQVSRISLPVLQYAVPCYYVIMPAEVSSNLSRYDGIRYGHSSREGSDLTDVYRKSRGEGFNSEVKRRLILGAYVLSSGYYDAYYKKAQQVRTLIVDGFNEAFNEHDYLIGPVSPSTAFKLGEKNDDPVEMYLTDVMTAGMSLAGIPAIAVPAGANQDGLPIGVQISGPTKSDPELIKIAKIIEDMSW